MAKFEFDPNKMYLFVKQSSHDRRKIGECYMCHRVRMVVRLKGLCRGSPDDKVVEVFVDPRHKHNKEKDPVFWEIDTTMLPVLVDGSTKHEYENVEEIEDHLEKHFPETPSLKTEDEEATKLSQERSPISDFAKWIKLDDKDSYKHGVKIAKFLHAIDDHLKKKGPFLTGNSLKIPDCILLPKLYHMQEIAKCVSLEHDCDLFKEFSALSEYMRQANEIDAFRSIKPSADEITLKWNDYRNKKGESSMQKLTHQ